VHAVVTLVMGVRATGAMAIGALAIGALAIGALAIGALAIGALGPWTSTAHAQESPASATSEADTEARGLFAAGREAYNDARYEEALGLFRRAYELSGRPAMLYNIGQTADRLRLDVEAMEAFESYLRALPQADNRVEVETRLAVLRRSVSERTQPSTTDGGVDGVLMALLVGAGVLVVAGVAVGVGVALYDPGTQAPPMGDVGPGGVVAALQGRFGP
jgi:tetratricopeptide (TPR) repeat protein